MIRSILHMGDPRLLDKAMVVDSFDSADLRALIKDMRETMRHHGAAGLAAPQMGVALRIVVFGGFTTTRAGFPETIPDTVLINPVLSPGDGALVEGVEGCLSLPGLRGMVPRFSNLSFSGKDEFGRPISGIATGFHARLLQHECDHLDGVLYPMRMADLSTLGFTEAMSSAARYPRSDR